MMLLLLVNVSSLNAPVITAPESLTVPPPDKTAVLPFPLSLIFRVESGKVDDSAVRDDAIPRLVMSSVKVVAVPPIDSAAIGEGSRRGESRVAYRQSRGVAIVPQRFSLTEERLFMVVPLESNVIVSDPVPLITTS